MLVLDFQAGNPQAFVEIHRRYGALARHVCQRFLPNRQDADEAFQEAMIRVFQGLYKFNGSYALAPWIARIAKNVSLDHVRGTSRRPQSDESAPAADELPRPGDEADEIVERLVQRDTVLSVLAELPEAHRHALMLREMEGRSHREIAEEMEISSGQAKALIHRAKGSFRKRWLEKTAERGGLLAIAFLPLVWLAKFESMIRRIGERAGAAAQTAQAAAPEAIAQTMTATATATPATVGLSERLVAAGVTILVAGSVTVGAAKIVNERAQPAPEEVAAAAAVIVSEPARSELQVDEVAEPESILERPRQDPVGEIPEGEVMAPTETTEPTEEVDPVPPEETTPPPDTAQPPDTAPSPAPSPQPEPSPEPPAPPPMPEWSYEFTTVNSEETCASCPEPWLVSGSEVTPNEDGFEFVQSIRGGARDVGGVPTWPFRLMQWGEIGSAGEGSLEYQFSLGSGGRRVFYGGQAWFSASTQLTNGGVEYRFDGNFALTGGQPEGGLPTGGVVSATVSVWKDGGIYAGSFRIA
jgi:RNA polymerase sigma-70 factor, ECF subfamily